MGADFYAGSRRLPAEIIGLPLASLTVAQCDFLAGELARHGLPGDSNGEPPVRFFELLSGAHLALLREARFYYPEAAELLELRDGTPSLLAAVPKLRMHGNLAVRLFVELAGLCAGSAMEGKPIEEWIGRARKQLDEIQRPSANSVQFLRAAYELEMPVIEWPWPHLQFGNGARSVVLKSSITDRTPGIGIAFARQKAECKALLAQAGFPFAEGRPVENLADAQRQAQALGYPVVVKPADLDGGEAVASEVRDEEELALAYRAARAASPNVLVERHIPGKDYRLLFFRDRLLIAIERTPGGVTGNGEDTVATLLERLNRDPDRGDGPESGLRKLEFDDDARLMLRRRGMIAESIPGNGEFVQLRRAANRSRGGTIRMVEDAVHPDNLDLARRAMQLLRLDFAGLDLIMPDISRSWHETGGVVCEVNAQPAAS